jgi:HEAT repeat protein
VASSNFEDWCRIIGQAELFGWFFVAWFRHPQLLDQGRFTMNPNLRLKVFPVVLLMVVQIVGMGGVARSQVVAQQSVNQSQNIDRLIQQLKTGDSQARSAAAYALGRLLNDSDKLVQGSTAAALLQTGESVTPSLIPLLKDPDKFVRVSAAAALSILQTGESVTPSLIPLLKDSDKFVRVSAAAALSRIGESAIPSLIPLLKDSDADVRSNVVFALGQMGVASKSAVPSLIPLLKDSDADVRSNAVDALGEILQERFFTTVSADPKAMYLLAKFIAPNLTPLLRDPDKKVRLRAAFTLASMGDTEAAEFFISSLLPLLKDSSDAPSKASYEIRKIGEAATPSLIRLLKDPNPKVRSRAALMLGNMTSPNNSDFLLSRTPSIFGTSNSVGLPTSAATALKRKRESARSSIPSLVPLLKDLNSEVRLNAAFTLGEMEESAKFTIPQIIPLLKDSNPDVRSIAAEALKTLGYQPSQQVSQSEEIDRLILQLKSPDPVVRSSAAKALGDMRESAKAAIPSLILLLKDSDSWPSAVMALERIGDSAIPSLISLLKGSDSVVRSFAAMTLERIGDSAIPSLIPLLRDEDSNVRSITAATLKRLGYKP